MKVQQCTFKRGDSYTQGWVDANKVNNAVEVELIGLGDEKWVVLHKGTIKEKNEVYSNRTFKNSVDRKNGEFK